MSGFHGHLVQSDCPDERTLEQMRDDDEQAEYLRRWAANNAPVPLWLSATRFFIALAIVTAIVAGVMLWYPA